MAGEFADQPVDRIGVGGREKGAIERHQYDRRAFGGEVEIGRLDHPGAWNIKAVAFQRGAMERRDRRQARGQRELCQGGARGIGSAAVAERLQPAQRRGRQVRGGVETRIGPAVARNDRQRNSLCRRQRADLLDAVAPILDPAEQANQNAARSRQRLLDVEIDRERMGQAAQIGKTQARQRLPPGAPRCGESAEITVGKRQHDEVRRGLAEILGDRGLLKSMPFPQQDMHASPGQDGGYRVVIEAALADHDDP